VAISKEEIADQEVTTKVIRVITTISNYGGKESTSFKKEQLIMEQQGLTRR